MVQGSAGLLRSLIHGVGEVDIRDRDEKEDRDTSFNEEQLAVPEVESLPYLLLDVRDEDAYKKCHIIGGGRLFQAPRPEERCLAVVRGNKNKLGKIIILYDEDERLAPTAATTFVQREVDNVFMLSGDLIKLQDKLDDELLSQDKSSRQSSRLSSRSATSSASRASTSASSATSRSSKPIWK
ncbi:Centrosomal protein of 41 kDa [Stylophora pistillata]|uniref:Centrosomal protein of 41 kDa n=1 Tax=Stylophora pistillata TaxID=50429 RepID=A0A2B4S444_STYPI|nr:Centrosomal protein of 41 kDa [Stylophora pistillata]